LHIVTAENIFIASHTSTADNGQ